MRGRWVARLEADLDPLGAGSGKPVDPARQHVAGQTATLVRVLGPHRFHDADGDEVAPFDHKVVTAYYWPVDELSARLHRAGFTEVERRRRPGLPEPGRRPHAAIAAIAR